MLQWMNILAVRGVSVDALVQDHWRRFGRNYHVRHDYEGVSSEGADALMAALRGRLADLAGTRHGDLVVAEADDSAYTDPVDGSVSANQGVRILFEGGLRVVYGLSGTGTSGATLRVYIERYEPADGVLDADPAEALSGLVEAGKAIASIEAFTDRTVPDVAT